ncbi:MAG: glycosyltransferase family 2 protein [Cyclobacteriaceae bacterium]
MASLFFIGLAVSFYTYLGYPIILGLLVKLTRLSHTSPLSQYKLEEMPEITLIVACYNEADILKEKIENTLQLDYPVNKVKYLFVTDGSTDNSEEIIRQYPEIELFHESERRGKNAAVNRVMNYVKTPITIYCDANTLLNKKSLQFMARHYKNERVGAVAGEKRVKLPEEGNAAGSGESAYWRYESKLKQWDSELHTVVGAAGELFSIRTELYEEVPKGVLIEDFRLSMNIAKKGYKVVYEPEAYAVETASESIEEESKRKVRISAGGLIEVWHFMPLLNFFKYGLLSFQYVSHRMLRWTLAPLSLVIVLISNIILILKLTHHPFFKITFLLQLMFYGLALIGYLLRSKNIKVKIAFIPYYFVFMNWSVFLGLIRLIHGKQSAVWEKAKRAK